MTDRHGKHQATEGVPILAINSLGGRHEVVLRAFQHERGVTCGVEAVTRGSGQ